MLKSIFLSTLVLLVHLGAWAQSGQVIVASYNVENLFDTIHDEGKNDYEYLPGGKAGWSNEKLGLKLERVAASIRLINKGKGPDIIAMPEVENIRVLKMLAAQLTDLGYTPYLLEGPDERGIDVGVLSKFPLAREPKMYRVDDPNDPTWKKPTRPVYEFVFKVSPTRKLGVLLNHWPSRMAGPEFRCKAALVLKRVFSLRMTQDPEIDFLALGDFNDEPEDTSILRCLGLGTPSQVEKSTPQNPLFYDPYFDKNQSKQQRGTYYFDKEKAWNALDHIILSKGLLAGERLRYVPGSFTNIRNSLNAAAKDMKLPNGKDIPAGAPIPFTAYQKDGETVAIGVSDHLPVRAVFQLNE